MASLFAPHLTSETAAGHHKEPPKWKSVCLVVAALMYVCVVIDVVVVVGAMLTRTAPLPARIALPPALLFQSPMYAAAGIPLPIAIALNTFQTVQRKLHGMRHVVACVHVHWFLSGGHRLSAHMLFTTTNTHR